MSTPEHLTPLAALRVCERCEREFPIPVKSPRKRFCSLSCANSRTRRKKSEAERFWPKVDKNGPIPPHRPELGPCWVWTAFRNPLGYGQFSLTGRSLVLAYRWAWEQEHGAVSDDRQLDHLCRNTSCVRPDHLEAVTPSVNVQRGLSGDLRPANPPREECANGHLLTPDNRYLRKDRTREQYGCRQCSRDRQSRYAERRRAA